MKFSRSFRGYDPVSVNAEIDLRHMYNKREEEEKHFALLKTQKEKEELSIKLDSMKGKFEADQGIVLLTEKYQKYVKTNLIQKAQQLAEQKIQNLHIDADEFAKDIDTQLTSADEKIIYLRREIKSVIKVVEDILEFNDFGQTINDNQIRQFDDVLAEFQARAEMKNFDTVLDDNVSNLTSIPESAEIIPEVELAKVALSNAAENQEQSIILAESDEDTARLIKQVLEPEGFRIIRAEDGSRVKELINEDPPPVLLLLSMQLPETDGIQLIKKVRAKEGYNDVPIIGLTNKHSEQEIVEILDSGAYDCLQKPFNPRELAARVKRFCGYSEKKP